MLACGQLSVSTIEARKPGYQFVAVGGRIMPEATNAVPSHELCPTITSHPTPPRDWPACRARPTRQGVRRHFGGTARDSARDLALRQDHGSQYMSDHFQKELAFLGIDSSPAFVRSPEGNGCAERFIRTLKENLLWVGTFKTIEELREALLAFRETCNTGMTPRSRQMRLPSLAATPRLPPSPARGRTDAGYRVG